MSHFLSSDGQNIGVGAFSEYSVLFPFRMDWLDLLSVQGTLKSLWGFKKMSSDVLFPPSPHRAKIMFKSYIWGDIWLL